MMKLVWPAVMREGCYELRGIHAEDAAKALGVLPDRAPNKKGEAVIWLTPPQKQALEAMGHQIKVFDR